MTVFESKKLDGIWGVLSLPDNVQDILFGSDTMDPYAACWLCDDVCGPFMWGLQFPLHTLFVDIYKYYGIQLR